MKSSPEPQREFFSVSDVRPGMLSTLNYEGDQRTFLVIGNDLMANGNRKIYYVIISSKTQETIVDFIIDHDASNWLSNSETMLAT